MSSRNDESLGAARVLSHLGVMAVVSVVLGLLVGGLAIPYVAALGVTSKTAARDIQQLPQSLETVDLAQASKMVDSRGKPMASFFDENRQTVRFKEISPNMIDAIIAVEDYRFYQHGALDLRGTARAFLTNQATGGAVVQGGSSITQQLAKMELLDAAKTDAERKAATADTYARKIKELRHAIAFEQNYSKNWILTRYLNRANFGDRAWGVQAAAQHYFSVDAADLSVRQAALLAGLVKNPSDYNPTEYPEDAKRRRNVVLDQMAKYGKITKAVAEKNKQRRLGLKVRKIRNGCQVSKWALFCDYVQSFLLADKSLGKTPEERLKLLQTGGLTIKTTMDPRFQTAATTAVTGGVYAKDQAVGALAMVEPGTGKVKAIAQSRPVGQDKEKGETSLNFAIPSNLGKAQSFQGASTFKLFVAAAALEQGQNPRQSFDVPGRISVNESDFPVCDGANYPVQRPWNPANFDEKGGNFDMYSGTQHSVNTYYVRLTEQTGLCDPFNLARKMGVQLTDRDHEMVPSFPLGVAGASPLEMAEAYATFAARGKHCDSQPVTEILNNQGKVFKSYKPRCSQVLSEYTADTVNDILRGVMAPGGFGQALALSVQSAGKTGTNDSNMSVWFNGYTPDVATAAVVAGANSNGYPISLKYQSVGGRYFGSQAFGSTVAGPIWASAMRAVVPYLKGTTFSPPGTPPAGQTEPGDAVPNVLNMTTDQALAVLRAAGFNPVVGGAVDSYRPAGAIAGQNPDGGAQVPPGSTVTVFPSNGANAAQTQQNNTQQRNNNGRPGRGRPRR